MAQSRESSVELLLRLKSEIVSALEKKHYPTSYIESAINDVKKRLLWKIRSRCEVFSRSGKVWSDGVIANISTDNKTNEEQLRVKYVLFGENRGKKIQRFCSDIRPIGIDYEEYELNQVVMEYITATLSAAEYVQPATYDDMRARQEDIKPHLVQCVLGFCRENFDENALYTEVVEIVLSFFATPMILNLKMNVVTKPIEICPVEGSWRDVVRGARTAFDLPRRALIGGSFE